MASGSLDVAPIDADLVRRVSTFLPAAIPARSAKSTYHDDNAADSVSDITDL